MQQQTGSLCISHKQYTIFKPVICSRKRGQRANRIKAHQTTLPQTDERQNKTPSNNHFLFKLVGLLFSIDPIWRLAKTKAKQKIAGRGSSIGVDQTASVENLRTAVPDWNVVLRQVENQDVAYPEYYVQPFHAYDQGNLSWEAAFEVPSAAQLVHAPVMDPDSKTLRADGDEQMRRSYSTKLLTKIKQAGAPVRNVVDLGCATGLSSVELARIFPEASITGIDLSPYFLAVGQVLGQHSQGNSKIRFKHAAAESTGLASGSADLVSISLMLHEVPQEASKAILAEAYRILKPTGLLSIMARFSLLQYTMPPPPDSSAEMNPASQRFQRMFSNPFAFVPFKATEPWLEEYIGLDLRQLLTQLGFGHISQEANTPGHFTLVAEKPA